MTLRGPAAILALLLASLSGCDCGVECTVDADCPAGLSCSAGLCVGGAGGGDTTPPTVRLTAPGAGALSGQVTLAVAAADDVGVVSVEYRLDGAPIASTAAPPFSASWSSTGAPNGPHTLTAVARDAAGNSGSAPAVGVEVGNYPGASTSVHTALGFPAPASTATPDQFLSVKQQYAVSYNGSRRGPNWVAWELSARWLGPVARQNDFRPDGTFPASEPQAQLADYAGSGYDRGHLCPSEDRTDTVEDNQATFYLTNMLPQADNPNGGPWAHLEAYGRALALAGKEVYVAAGGVFPAAPATIGPDQVAVPGAFWKVIAVLDAPGQGPAEVTAQTRVIAVLMPNDNAVVPKSADWKSFRVSVGEVEAKTGLAFFTDVDWPVRDALRTVVDAAN